MKIILNIFYCSLSLFSSVVNAQDRNKNMDDKFFNSGVHSNALVYFNNSIFEKELYTLNPDTIGVIFAEGDSSYVKNTYGDNADTSLIYRYFGDQRDRGILFIYTKDKVEAIRRKQFNQCLKNRKCKVLYKIDNEPLTDSYNLIDPKQIQMVRDFTLQHWDTRIIDTFTLFIIKTQ